MTLEQRLKAGRCSGTSVERTAKEWRQLQGSLEESNEVVAMGRKGSGGIHHKGSCMPGQEIRNFTKNLLYTFSKLFFLYIKLG